MTTNPLDRVSLRNPVHFLALGFGSGLLRTAPGTWGTLAGLLAGVILLQWLNLISFLILTALCFVVGCFICQKTANDMGVHDHGAIVWDEIVAMFVVLAAAPAISVKWCLVAFVLFRIFDIFKPFPISYFDRKLENGFGIMFDDLLAAVYTAAAMFFLYLFI